MASKQKGSAPETNDKAGPLRTTGTRVPGRKRGSPAVATTALGDLLRGDLLIGSEPDFLRQIEAIRATLRPVDVIEGLLVDRFIQATWRLRQIAQNETKRNGLLDPASLAIEATAEQTLMGTLEALERRRAQRPIGFGRPAAALARPSVPPEDEAFSASAIEFLAGSQPDSAEPDAGDDPVAWRGRLIFDANVSEDSPVVRGTWVTVNHVISLIVDGWTWPELLRTHPELTEDDLRACLAYHVQEEAGDPPTLV